MTNTAPVSITRGPAGSAIVSVSARPQWSGQPLPPLRSPLANPRGTEQVWFDLGRPETLDHEYITGEGGNIIVVVSPQEDIDLPSGGVLTKFIHSAIKQAVVEQLSDGTFVARIPSCPGVWADGKDKRQCLIALREVLEDWLLFKLRDGDDIPVVAGADLNIKFAEESSC